MARHSRQSWSHRHGVGGDLSGIRRLSDSIQSWFHRRRVGGDRLKDNSSQTARGKYLARRQVKRSHVRPAVLTASRILASSPPILVPRLCLGTHCLRGSASRARSKHIRKDSRGRASPQRVPRQSLGTSENVSFATARGINKPELQHALRRPLRRLRSGLPPPPSGPPLPPPLTWPYRTELRATRKPMLLRREDVGCQPRYADRQYVSSLNHARDRLDGA